MMYLAKNLKQFSAYASLPLRLALGVVFVAHGLQKLQAPDMVSGFFISIGFPGWMGAFVGSMELLGGVLLLIGLFTRYAALIISIIMVVAILKLKLTKGIINGFELELALLGGALALLLLGPGKLSLDNDLLKKEF